MAEFLKFSSNCGVNDFFGVVGAYNDDDCLDRVMFLSLEVDLHDDRLDVAKKSLRCFVNSTTNEDQLGSFVCCEKTIAVARRNAWKRFWQSV